MYSLKAILICGISCIFLGFIAGYIVKRLKIFSISNYIFFDQFEVSGAENEKYSVYFKDPIVLTIYKTKTADEDGNMWYEITHHPLEIFTIGRTPQQILGFFNLEYMFLFENYGIEEDQVLTKDAIQLKHNIMNNIKSYTKKIDKL
jgi:hypothetical protein